MEADETYLTTLIDQGKKWIQEQRDSCRDQGKSLSDMEKRALSSHFAIDILDLVRICPVESIKNPPFFADMFEEGEKLPMDFTNSAGITFVDTVQIAASKVAPERWLSLLFHELVHVIQYDILGLDTFMDWYVRGWADNDFDYFKIPLEKEAYDLQHRFERNPALIFSVQRTLWYRHFHSATEQQ